MNGGYFAKMLSRRLPDRGAGSVVSIEIPHYSRIPSTLNSYKELFLGKDHPTSRGHGLQAWLCHFQWLCPAPTLNLLTKRGIQLAYGELKWCVTKCSKPPIVRSKWTAGIWEFPELVSEDTPGSTASYCRKHALNR